MAVLRKSIHIAPVIAAAILSACATPEGEFPSLERRPFETATAEVEPALALPTELTPELTEKVKVLTTRHGTANASFSRDLPRVRSIAQRAAGSARGGEAWVNAHLELSRLDHGRADSVAALGELDQLIAAQADSDSNYIALLNVHQEAMAGDVAMQRSSIEQLSQTIGE